MCQVVAINIMNLFTSPKTSLKTPNRSVILCSPPQYRTFTVHETQKNILAIVYTSVPTVDSQIKFNLKTKT